MLGKIIKKSVKMKLIVPLHSYKSRYDIDRYAAN